MKTYTPPMIARVKASQLSLGTTAGGVTTADRGTLHGAAPGRANA